VNNNPIVAITLDCYRFNLDVQQLDHLRQTTKMFVADPVSDGHEYSVGSKVPF
jgi:hypothetical protein